MSAGDKTTGMKSAYELALERLEERGIEPPRQEALDPELREQIEEVRRRTEAKLAELEILFQDRLAATADPTERAQAEDEYASDRRRLQERRDREIEEIRTRT